MYTLPENIKIRPAIQSYGGGVAFLNQWFPGWYRHISLDVLDMSNGKDCIFGQLAKVTTGYADDSGSVLYSMFFNRNSFYYDASIFSCCCAFAGVCNAKDHTNNWKKIIKDLRSANETSAEPSDLQKQLEEAKALVKDLEDKIEQERKKNEVITLTLTRAEIEGLLNRRVGAVKEKILKQLEKA